METFKRNFRLGCVLILLVLLFASSCDDDIEESDGIVGKWMLKEMKMEFKATDDGEVIVGTGVATNNNAENYVIFKDDNTVNANSSVVQMVVTGSVDGEKVSYVQPLGANIPEQGSWSIKDDKITLIGGEETAVYVIKTLTKSTLTLYGDETLNPISGSPGDYFRMTLVYSRL